MAIRIGGAPQILPGVFDPSSVFTGLVRDNASSSSVLLKGYWIYRFRLNFELDTACEPAFLFKVWSVTKAYKQDYLG